MYNDKSEGGCISEPDIMYIVKMMLRKRAVAGSQVVKGNCWRCVEQRLAEIGIDMLAR